jgi:NAD(P)-dependent dehydrogenase (short-subunit alcohol dehydrogenase family)
MEIAGKVAIVTGAASGIGRASALALAAAGATVVVADVDDAGGRETVEQIRALGATASFVATDVSDPASVGALFAAAEREYGGVDIVHNNAGLVSGEPLWPAIEPATLMRLLDVNLGGVALGIRFAVDALRKRGGGVIVNTASLAAQFPLTQDPMYSATKAGVVMFTRACAPLAGEGIRVNSVLPALVDTPLLPKTGDGSRWAEWARSAESSIGLIKAEEVADAVVALVRDDTAVAQERVVGPMPGA